MQTCGVELIDHRFNDVDLLPAQVPAFPGMGVQSANGDTRALNAKVFVQIRMKYAQHTPQVIRGNSLGYLRQRQMGRGQGNAQAPCRDASLS